MALGKRDGQKVEFSSLEEGQQCARGGIAKFRQNVIGAIGPHALDVNKEIECD